jgi:hypothetical protein
MVDYINDLSDSNLETLEQIISLQYRKFIRFYQLIEKYSGIIKKVQYEFISPSSLDVVLIFDTKRKLENIKKEIDDEMEKLKYDGSTEVKKKTIAMSIVLDESIKPKQKKNGTKSK